MGTLRPACACSRYLSPTRLSTSVSHPRHFSTGTAHLSPPYSPLVLQRRSRPSSSQRWHSTASPPASRWRQLHHRGSGSASESQGGGEYVQPPQTPAASLGGKDVRHSLESLTANLKQWTKDKTSVIDKESLIKIVSQLNIELPKNYEKVLPTLLRVSAKPTETDQPKQPQENWKVEQAQLHERQERRRKLLESDSHESVYREQHNLESAMSSTQESIQTYYGSIQAEGPREDGGSRKRLQDFSNNQHIKATVVAPEPLPEPQPAQETNLVQRLSNLIPNSANKSKEDAPTEGQKRLPVRREMVAKGSIDRRTRGLVIALKQAPNNMSRLIRLEELCKHLLQYPDAKNMALKERVLPLLLRLRRISDQDLRAQAREALSLVGYANPPIAWGVRILSLDGGGTRGLMSLDMLKELEAVTGRRIHEMFDFVCGVSTGALIAAMVSTYRASLEECEHIYKEFSTDAFQQNRLLGAGKLFLNHSYYDSALWENILKDNLGTRTFLDTTRDPKCPKYAAVSTVVNKAAMQNFLFRNYTYPSGVYSHYPGSMRYAIWEAIRASSAAPGYFEEFKQGDQNHQDGGLLTNNPTAVAIHECKLLWPNDAVQCVVSMGTGRFRPAVDEDANHTGLKNMVLKIVQSATDTEAVHTILHDLLPPSTYFRFNPYMSEDFQLDEIREDKWSQMSHDVGMYCRKNEAKFQAAAQCLLQEKSPAQKAVQWLKAQQQMALGKMNI